MTQSFAHATALRARLVVLSDRRPAPGAPRTGVESAIELALREHDGIWLVRHAASESGPIEAGALASGDREPWSVLGVGDAAQRSSTDEWSAYVRANASYAERIIELISPDGTVWINGHRWMLVGSALRGHGHRGPTGLLLDVPFPSHDQLEALPWYADVMSALCQLDLIGFRTPACAENFEACRVRVGRHRPWIGVFPGDSAAPTPSEWVASFLQLLGSAARRDPRRGFIE